MIRVKLANKCLLVLALLMTITAVTWLEYINHIHPDTLLPIYEMTNYSNNVTITRAFDTDVYLFSAFIVRYEYFQYPFDMNTYRVNNNASTDVILINGWQREKVESENFKCCVLLMNNTVMEINSHWKNMIFASSLRAMQYVCPSAVETDLIKLVSVVLGYKKCSENSKYYVNLNKGSLIRNSELAVCTKLTYDSVNAAQLVEWFEAQRVLGVDKIVTYPFNLNVKIL